MRRRIGRLNAHNTPLVVEVVAVMEVIVVMTIIVTTVANSVIVDRNCSNNNVVWLWRHQDGYRGDSDNMKYNNSEYGNNNASKICKCYFPYII